MDKIADLMCNINIYARVEQIEELCRAAGQGDLDSVKQLLGSGISVNATVEFFGRYK